MMSILSQQLTHTGEMVFMVDEKTYLKNKDWLEANQITYGEVENISMDELENLKRFHDVLKMYTDTDDINVLSELNMIEDVEFKKIPIILLPFYKLYYKYFYKYFH